MKTALIDNQDSFTYNIVDLAGKIPENELSVIPYDGISTDELEDFDNLILSPGPGLPDEFPLLQDVLKKYHTSKSFLGICLGHEAIAKFFGAELLHLPSVVHGQPKVINVVKESAFYRNVPERFKAGLYHSWVIDKDKFPADLEITGLSDEGNIMSFQHKTLNLFGVQFHPESIITEYGKEMMENFLKTGNTV